MSSIRTARMSPGWVLALVFGGVLVGTALMGRNDTRAAEGAASGKKPVVAVVDLFKVLNESRMYKDLKERLKDSAEKKRAEANRREETAKQAQKIMEAFKRTAPEFREKFKTFVDSAVDYNAYVKLSQAEQILMLNKGTWEVYQAIVETVHAVAKDNGVDVVLYLDEFEPNLQDTQQLLAQIRQRKVLHHAKDVDLTDQVLQRFDADYRKSASK
ncbi:MAG: OmpH family outer membrane protein [Phycisphaerae bacterium]|nr:OmpH family outer membrane protein [Phycisphaerae bacterium]